MWGQVTSGQRCASRLKSSGPLPRSSRPGPAITAPEQSRAVCRSPECRARVSIRIFVMVPKADPVSGPSSAKNSPISDWRELVEYLEAGCKPASEWRIGTEHEKFGFRLDDLRPPTWEGERGIGALLQGLTRYG